MKLILRVYNNTPMILLANFSTFWLAFSQQRKTFLTVILQNN